MKIVEGFYDQDSEKFFEYGEEQEDQDGWCSSYERFQYSWDRLKKFREKKLTTGVEFLDKAIGGIISDDLLLVGAPSGVGKTGFVTNIAKANVLQGRRVHVIALEAYEGEIEDRIKYTLLAKLFYADEERERGHISYRGWIEGKHDVALEKYELDAQGEAIKLYNLHTFYRTKNFTIQDFEREAFNVHQDTDLIILDHVHYFDIEDRNEHQGFKMIVKKIREVTQETGIPVVLVAHLRKRDKQNNELVAGIDEFHGSSDLTKIATKIISIGKGQLIDRHNSETFFRIPKNRMDGSVSYYCLKMVFNFELNDYIQNKSQIGILTNNGKSFEMLDKSRYPDWYR